MLAISVELPWFLLEKDFLNIRPISQLALLGKIRSFFRRFLETAGGFVSRERDDFKKSANERDKNRRKRNDFGKQMKLQKRSISKIQG